MLRKSRSTARARSDRLQRTTLRRYSRSGIGGTAGDARVTTRQSPRAFARSRRRVRARLGARSGSGGIVARSSRVASSRADIRRASRFRGNDRRARVSRSTRRGSTRARAIGSGRERTRALTGYRTHSEASTGPRFERRRARARARVGPLSRKKGRQRGTFLTRIAPAVQARWRGEPPTRAPRKPRSRAARRRWRRYARAKARTKTRTSPRLEPPPPARRGAGGGRKPRFGISVLSSAPEDARVVWHTPFFFSPILFAAPRATAPRDARGRLTSPNPTRDFL